MRFGSQKPTPRKSQARAVGRTGSTPFNSDAGQSANNRAEEIRSRRAKRSQERISQVSSRVTSPPPAHPVTVRGGSRPIHQQIGTTRPRRQFYLTMDRAAGTEVRLPAVPEIHIGWRLASGLLAIVMTLGIYSMWNSPFTQVQSVEIQGITRLNLEEVAAKLNLENHSIIEIDPAQVQDTLYTAYPELINVHVSVGMPNAVDVSAEERQPVLAIQQGDQLMWVDASGVLFPARGDAGKLRTIQAKDGLPLAPVPLTEAQQAAQEASSTEGDNAAAQAAAKPVPVTGPVRIDPTVLTALDELGKKLPAETQLVYSKQDGLGWKAAQGWQVFIGKDLSNFEAKYAMYQQVASYLKKQGLQPSLVSVEQLNAPYFRSEQ
jgi:cell division protein FtsQ